jgi:hypothetical protein
MRRILPERQASLQGQLAAAGTQIVGAFRHGRIAGTAINLSSRSGFRGFF